ncbi:hypothetical protein EYF80_065794 [Liparis tanakae]|uniref:Uncharacterized protein n=1 Tax=Liparis tanakae TaxID=230148 RepID=A0A4Z2E608_9TELE|nr:hypothetical protein EYF80_065794 [Liparis tanakae]
MKTGRRGKRGRRAGWEGEEEPTGRETNSGLRCCFLFHPAWNRKQHRSPSAMRGTASPCRLKEVRGETVRGAMNRAAQGRSVEPPGASQRPVPTRRTRTHHYKETQTTTKRRKQLQRDTHSYKETHIATKRHT